MGLPVCLLLLLLLPFPDFYSSQISKLLVFPFFSLAVLTSFTSSSSFSFYFRFPTSPLPHFFSQMVLTK
jgi:hypothetical protein